MRAFIHAFQGRPWNEECEAALNGFTKLGVECRLFSTNEELDTGGPEDFEDGTVIMGGDPAPDVTIEEIRILAEKASTEREISNSFAVASNKARWIEDNEYDYEEGTAGHEQACKEIDEWFSVSDFLKEKIFTILKAEGVTIPDQGQIAVLSLFMERNGYRDGRGWWVKRKTVYILMGIQGSGKSTFCSKYLPDVERINLDTLL